METVPDGKTLHNIQLSLEELRGDMKAIGAPYGRGGNIGGRFEERDFHARTASFGECPMKEKRTFAQLQSETVDALPCVSLPRMPITP